MDNKTLLVTFQNNTNTVGLKYIHSYLREKGVDSHILFVPKYDEKDVRPVEAFLGRFRPKIIGVSLMSPEFDSAKRFSLAVKKEFPETIIVWGGMHPSIDPEKCLDYADYVFRGESEQAYFEFADAISKNKPVSGIQNLAYKSSGTVMINKLRPLNENLDSLPFPEHFPEGSFILDKGKVVRLNKSLFRKYTRYSGKFYSLTTSRGCPFSCAYCCNSFFTKLYGKQAIRKRSVENVIGELKLAVRYFPDLVYLDIQDDNFFSYDLDWMKEFTDRFRKEIRKKFVCRTTPAHVSEEKISLLKKAGLSWVFMGLQSGSPRVNREIYKRYVTNEKFIEATEIVRKYDIAGYYDIILDNPYETEEDLVETINVILKIPKPFMLQLFSLCFYQGTELYDRALKENVLFENPVEKNYSKYRPTYLNRVIRLCPLLPKRFIESLVKNRESRFYKASLDFIYFPSILILEPLAWLGLILKSFDYDVFATAKMILPSLKTGFNKMILRK